MKRSQNGFVLISVLWVTVILTVLVVGFGRRAMLDRRAATISMDYSIVRAEARGQVQEGAVDIVNTMALFAILGRRTGGVPIPQFQFKSAPEPEVTGEKGNFQIEDMTYFTIEDEERKIPINAASEELLEAIPGLTFSMVNEIISRRGGESADDEETPYQSIEEIREIDGISDDDWFGDENEPGLRDVITLWGDGKINLNTASEAVLRLIPDIDEDIITGIVEFRQGPDGRLGTDDDVQFGNMSDISKRLELSAGHLSGLREFVKLESSYYRITGVATLRGGKVRASSTAIISINRSQSEVLRWSEDSPRG
jgi:DNA uptake protein ComE-like DNA-binding protein